VTIRTPQRDANRQFDPARLYATVIGEAVPVVAECHENYRIEVPPPRRFRRLATAT
jgi:hypothetical protein